MRALVVSFCRYLAGVGVFFAAADLVLRAPWPFAAGSAAGAAWFWGLATWIRRTGPAGTTQPENTAPGRGE